MLGIGTFTASVLEHSIKQNDRTGSWYVNILFAVDSGSGDEKMWGKIYLTDKAMGIARKSLKAMGFDVDQENLRQLDEHQTLLAGNLVNLEIDENNYGSQTTLQIKSINPIPKPKDPSLYEDLTRKLREVKKNRSNSDEMFSEEDVPF